MQCTGKKSTCRYIEYVYIHYLHTHTNIRLVKRESGKSKGESITKIITVFVILMDNL